MKPLLTGILLTATLITTGCYPALSVSRTEETRFAGIPEITRIDRGAENYHNKTEVSGYFRQEAEEGTLLTYSETVRDTDFNYFDTTYTTTLYKSYQYQPQRSLGADITHSFSSVFGFGGQFDYAALQLEKPARNTYSHALSFVRGGFHFRLTKTVKYLTIGYRPEFMMGIFTGTIIAKESSSESITNTDSWFKKGFLTFGQTFFAGVSPIPQIRAFGGLQHNLKPFAIVDNNCQSRNSFAAYGGIGAQLLDMFTLNVYVTSPILTEYTAIHNPISVGGSIGFIFGNKED